MAFSKYRKFIFHTKTNSKLNLNFFYVKYYLNVLTVILKTEIVISLLLLKQYFYTQTYASRIFNVLTTED